MFFLQFLTSFLNLINIGFLFNISLFTNHKIPFTHSAHVAQFHISLLKGRGESFLDKSCFPSLLPSSLFPITATLEKAARVHCLSILSFQSLLSLSSCYSTTNSLTLNYSVKGPNNTKTVRTNDFYFVLLVFNR